MTYVVSNIHGNYDKFKALLREISFRDTDVMYILGDFVDYGEFLEEEEMSDEDFYREVLGKV